VDDRTLRRLSVWILQSRVISSNQSYGFSTSSENIACGIYKVAKVVLRAGKT
jgi:hypothetical protein